MRCDGADRGVLLGKEKGGRTGARRHVMSLDHVCEVGEASHKGPHALVPCGKCPEQANLWIEIDCHGLGGWEAMEGDT